VSSVRVTTTWGSLLLAAGFAVALLLAPGVAGGHGAEDPGYRTVIEKIEPDGLPIDVSVAKGDQLRIENLGDEELVVCGYTGGACEPYVRIGPDGVYENRNSSTYYANLEQNKFGDIPANVGEGGPTWKLVRREPAFYSYHDHRSHWMGGAKLPPGIDDGDPKVQKVNDFNIDIQYDGRDGNISGRLEYVGGQTFFMRYGEYGITLAAILAMLVVFAMDARRRKQQRIATFQATQGATGVNADAEADDSELGVNVDAAAGAAEVTAPSD